MSERRSTLTDAPPVENANDHTIAGVVLGIFLGFADDGDALVDYPGNPTGCAIRARAAAVIDARDRGRDAALLFEDRDPMRPIIVGLIQAAASPSNALSVERDGEDVEITAKRQIVLRCGEASITLTRSGKVLIRGKYVLSRSSGVNMIKGGVVHLN
jgi:hypothetical protein